MTRAEHLDWSKQRALAECDRGDTIGAFASIVSDLNKHPETHRHAGIELGMMQMVAGLLSTPEAMRTFIEGFR